jgi:CubicO group peptidase (beta-lactamase class C family)
LAKYVTDYPRGDEITLRHLLTHTSGILNYTGVDDYWRQDRLPLSHDQMMAFFRDAPLDFVPGARWGSATRGITC